MPVVLDPVLASGHGDVLSRDDAVLALAPLLPLTTVIVPNGPEALALGGAENLHAQGCQHVLVTGGHGDGEAVLNRWFDAAGGKREWLAPFAGRLPRQRLHSGLGHRGARHWAGHCPGAGSGAKLLPCGPGRCIHAIAPGQLMPQRFIQ